MTGFPGGTVVFADRVYRISLGPADEQGTAKASLTLDDTCEWGVRIATWRGVSWGVSGDLGYLWSAREIVVLPDTAQPRLRTIRMDEDLLTVFRRDDGWVLICETSVRWLAGDEETARVEFGEVIDVARWEDNLLLVRDTAGQVATLVVDGRRLRVRG